MGKKRQANFELLRIVAMLMIIVLHYLIKGEVVTEGEYLSPVHYLAGLLESLCMVSVNCYVLISGYFLVESEWKPGRIGSLICQILFYSLLIPVVMLVFGLHVNNFTVYDWIGYLFPIQTEHYWFATAYIILYLLTPFLAAGMKQMEKRKLQLAIIILLCFFSLGKTILPVLLATDRYGYDFGWFICLFLVAGYLRLYGIPLLEKRTIALLVYIGSSVASWGISVLSGVLSEKAAVFHYYMQMPYTYNYLLCLIGSVGLFYVFKNSSLGEGKAAKIVCFLAPYTFGVYLLHEHNLIRYQWIEWSGVENVKNSFSFIPHMFSCVLLIYAVGTVVDFVRAWLFGKLAGILPHKTDTDVPK